MFCVVAQRKSHHRDAKIFGDGAQAAAELWACAIRNFLRPADPAALPKCGSSVCPLAKGLLSCLHSNKPGWIIINRCSYYHLFLCFDYYYYYRFVSLFCYYCLLFVLIIIYYYCSFFYFILVSPFPLPTQPPLHPCNPLLQSSLSPLPPTSRPLPNNLPIHQLYQPAALSPSNLSPVHQLYQPAFFNPCSSIPNF